MTSLPGAAKFNPGPAPSDYKPGVGRGATGFSTRAEYGTIQKDAKAADKPKDPFGAPPPGYIPGRGRGATGFAGGVSRDESTEGGAAAVLADKQDYSDANYDEFSGYSGSLFSNAEYDEEDRQADEVYESIDVKMDARRKSRREAKLKEELAKMRAEKPTIHHQFADLKRGLGAVSREEWEAIPDIGDYSLKQKQKKAQNYSATPDAFLVDARAQSQYGGSFRAGGGMQTPLMGMQTPMGLKTPMGLMGGMATPLSGLRTPMGGSATPSLNDLGEAREKVLSVKLDRVMDSVSGQTVMDPKGYLTDLNAMQLKSDADIADLKKARLLLKSVITTNTKHAPGWIAAARLEEMAGKLQAARELIAQGCKACPDNEDVWLEAARLEKPANAKAVLAQAVRQIPRSVRLWLDAAQRETEKETRARVLRKALEFIPNSVRLWKEAISLEEPKEARIMLSRAVECVPTAVELWLALARLSAYQDAQRVLNAARKQIPNSALIWVAAAKLEETQGNEKNVDLVINKSVESLDSHKANLNRETWLKLAEEAEQSKHILTCKAIVKATMKVDVEDHNMKRIWKEDAEACLSRGSIETARALFNNAVTYFKTKKGMWLALADLEAKHGTAESLDAVLQRAVVYCPTAEVLWLMAAKQKWIHGDVPAARRILSEAASHNVNTEAIMLAAVKLERENMEIERARLLLRKARDTIGTPKVWMQSVQLEREQGKIGAARALLEQAVAAHPSFAKLWMVGGQLYLEEEPPMSRLEEAAEFFQRGLQECPKSVPLWLCAADCQRVQRNWTKARALLERARLKNPGQEELWLASIQIEREADNLKMAHHLLSRALQDCPQSGILWSEAVWLEPKSAQNAKSVDALTKCDNDAHVILTVAKLFWRDGKIAKARKWFNRAVTLNAALGDAWGAYLAFELENGSEDLLRDVIQRCVQADPNKGLLWNKVVKRVQNWRLKVPEKMCRYVEEAYPEALKKDSIPQLIRDVLEGRLEVKVERLGAASSSTDADAMQIDSKPPVKLEQGEGASSSSSSSSSSSAAADHGSRKRKLDGDVQSPKAIASSSSSSSLPASSANGAKMTSTSPKMKAGSPRGDADFTPSASFQGDRQGYVYATGDRGAGYYRDVKRLKQ